MKQSLTHHQEVVCRFLAQASLNTKPEFYEAFMKACLLAMREQKIPVTLLCREVRRHMVRDKQYKAYALEVEGSAIGFKGSVGWKAIAADHAHLHNSEPAPASYLLSATKPNMCTPPRFKITSSCSPCFPRSKPTWRHTCLVAVMARH
jgi:hypothetical protein